MSSEKLSETKDTEDSKPNPLPSVLKSKSKDAVNEETNKSKRVVFQEKPVIINKTVSKPGENAKTETVDFDKQKEKKDRVRPPTKVVVRRLPPTMTLDVFIDLVSPLPEHDFIYFVPADMSMGSNAFSRVYINFVNMADLLTFHEQFDNYVFMDNKGNEYPAVVEFAQFQRIPKKRQGKKRDLKAGTLKDDPEYITFLETLREKKEANSSKQTIDVVVPQDKPAPKITTTPLLEYIKQRRAEQQKLRDEKREERRRKELERKRIKDEEKKRRKDGESVLKVLRSHETEDNEDSKSGKDVKEKEWSPVPQGSQSSKRRDDDKVKQREEKKKERLVPDNRARDVKSRETGPKSYRDERQKLAEGRIQRKLADDQRKKVVNERNQNTKPGDAHHSQEFEKSISSKDTHVRKSYKEMRDTDRKSCSDRHSIRDDKNVKESENRRSYRDSDGRRHDRYMYGKDSEHKRSTYGTEHRKSAHSYGEPESRKKTGDGKVQEKEVTTKKVVDLPGEQTDAAPQEKEIKTECHQEPEHEAVSSVEESNAQLDISEEVTCQQDHKKSTLKRSSSVGEHGSNQSAQFKTDEKVIVDINTKAGQPLKRSSSLDFTNVSVDTDSKDVDTVLEEKTNYPGDSLTGETISKNISSTDDSKSYNFDDKNEEIGNTSPEHSLLLDCGDNQRDSYNIHTEEEALDFMDEKGQTVEQEEGEDQDKGIDDMQNENEVSNSESCEIKDDPSVNKPRDIKSNDSSTSSTTSGNTSGNITESESKRDPRTERRIRNKDRPSIEIYRPGMGRFSMQRKEREKCTVTGSSLEQDSPSTSPTSSPSLRPISASRSRAGQELRSMTFKRSVSREK